MLDKDKRSYIGSFMVVLHAIKVEGFHSTISGSGWLEDCFVLVEKSNLSELVDIMPIYDTINTVLYVLIKEGPDELGAYKLK